MSVVSKKKEIINWISSLEDKVIINQIDHYRKTHQSFDFKKEIKTAISSNELKERTTEFIKSLEWKK